MAVDRQALGSWALTAGAAVTLAFILLPLVFVSWLAFFQQPIPAFPPQGANCAPSGGSAAAKGRKRGGSSMDVTAIDKRTMGRWALTGVAGVTFGFILLPLIFVTWLAFFQQAIPSFPPQGYSLKWFFAISENPKFVDGFVLSLQVAVVATIIAAPSRRICNTDTAAIVGSMRYSRY